MANISQLQYHMGIGSIYTKFNSNPVCGYLGSPITCYVALGSLPLLPSKGVMALAVLVSD